MELEGKPEIEYPCPWTYKVIGKDEDDVRRAVKVMLAVCLDQSSGDRAWELSLSRTSGQGKYVSLNLRLLVPDEATRLRVYEQLQDSDAVRLVL